MKNNPGVFLVPLLVGLLLTAGCTGPNPSTQSDASRSETTDREETRSEYDLPAHHFIRRGMSVERVRSLVGDPEAKQQKDDRTEVWKYTFGVVLVKQGTVQYKYPPSRRERSGQQSRPGSNP